MINESYGKKIEGVLHAIKTNCFNKKQVPMLVLTKALGVSSNLGTSVVKTGIVKKKGKGRRVIYEWIGGDIDKNMIDTVIEAYREYSKLCMANTNKLKTNSLVVENNEIDNNYSADITESLPQWNIPSWINGNNREGSLIAHSVHLCLEMVYRNCQNNKQFNLCDLIKTFGLPDCLRDVLLERNFLEWNHTYYKWKPNVSPNHDDGRELFESLRTFYKNKFLEKSSMENRLNDQLSKLTKQEKEYLKLALV